MKKTLRGRYIMKKTLRMVYLSWSLFNELYNGMHVVNTPHYEYVQVRTAENGCIRIHNYRTSHQTGESEEIQIRCRH